MGVLNLRLSNDRAEKKVPQEVEGMTACHASEDRGPWYGVTLPSTFESASATLRKPCHSRGLHTGRWKRFSCRAETL